MSCLLLVPLRVVVKHNGKNERPGKNFGKKSKRAIFAHRVDRTLGLLLTRGTRRSTKQVLYIQIALEMQYTCSWRRPRAIRALPILCSERFIKRWKGVQENGVPNLGET